MKIKAQIFSIQRIEFDDSKTGELVKMNKVVVGIPEGKGFNVLTQYPKTISGHEVTGQLEEFDFELTSAGKIRIVF